MKKNYNQPQVQVMALMPTAIICASVTKGAPITSGGSSIEEYGD